MLTELREPLPVITPKGKAFARYIIDYGMESNLLFVCFQDDTGECWTWGTPDIRLQNNITLGRVIKKDK